ncbi:hypothetical protein [Komagataeibacter sp. FNDCF1]|uniref:hypothetical protein n=1 Tax=Komagataeibacter sp. FNDCF1 TaxID=2878681 RepID=UPI001E36B23B|nr:hypothetical protein [Komagataeibacter sp. FNDCF1]MCE2565376.1 hypothetical protein [Komagataeibacter sp. FNDCF1]
MAELPLAPLPRARRPKRHRPGPDAPPASAPSAALPQPDLFAAPQVAGSRLTYLDNATLGLARVDMRGWRPGDGPDSYLYHVTQRDGMATIEARGTIVFSPRAPLVLTERPGVGPWLANMMEVMEPDEIAGHSDETPVVFRVKRFVIDELLEHDPDRTRRYGVSFFLLTGLARSD